MKTFGLSLLVVLACLLPRLTNAQAPVSPPYAPKATVYEKTPASLDKNNDKQTRFLKYKRYVEQGIKLALERGFLDKSPTIYAVGSNWYVETDYSFARGDFGATATLNTQGGNGGALTTTYELGNSRTTFLIGVNFTSQSKVTFSSSSTATTALGSSLLNPASSTLSFTGLVDYEVVNAKWTRVFKIRKRLPEPKEGVRTCVREAIGEDATVRDDLFKSLKQDNQSVTKDLDGIAEGMIEQVLGPRDPEAVNAKDVSVTTLTGMSMAGQYRLSVFSRFTGGTLTFEGPQSTGATTTVDKSGAILGYSVGIQNLWVASNDKGNALQAGFEAGWTFRQLAGDIDSTSSSASSFRQAIFGTNRTYFNGFEATAFLIVNDRFKPFIRFTWLAPGDISGFSGKQLVIGVDALAATF